MRPGQGRCRGVRDVLQGLWRQGESPGGALSAWWDGLAGFLFPEEPVCPGCGAPFPARGFQGLCLDCYDGFGFFEGWRPLPLALAHAGQVAALGTFGGPLRRGVHRLKFRADRLLGLAFGSLMGALVAETPSLPAFDAIVPVPLHPGRAWRRGFNQAETLAQGAADVLALPVLAGALARRRPTEQQARLAERDRRRNVEGAFAVPDPRAVEGKALLLVDDVVTTGATFDAAAGALREAGAAAVWGLALAAAPPPGTPAAAGAGAAGGRGTRPREWGNGG